MPPALTSISNPPSFRPLRRRRVPSTVLCRVGAGKPAADDEDANSKKRPFFADFGGKLTETKLQLIPAAAFPSSLFAGGRGRKDPQTVFVAGATGQVGVRIARKLLRQGFTVRAGVPDLASAQDLARLATTYGLISSAEARRLNAVESDLDDDDAEAIAKSIGSATKLVVTVGPAEKAAGAAVVTTDDALRVVQAADLAGVSHVVVVVYDDDDGAAASTNTNNVLDGGRRFAAFFSNLFSRVGAQKKLTLTEFLAKVVETTTDVKYTVLKAASLTDDDYSPESTYGLLLAKEGSSTSMDTTSKVSKLQIASLVADVISNVEVAENKVVQVSTSSSATSKPIEEAFAAIPEDSRRKEYQEAVSKAQAAAAEEAAMASQRAEDPSSKMKAQGEKKTVSEEEAASAAVNGAQASLENLVSRAKGLSTDFSWENFSTQLAARRNNSEDKEVPKAQIATVRGQARAKKLAPQRADVVKQNVKQKVAPTTEVRPVFGGLFKQETIFVDED